MSFLQLGVPQPCPGSSNSASPTCWHRGALPYAVWDLHLETGQCQTLIPGKPPGQCGPGPKGRLGWTSTLTPHLSVQPEMIPSVLLKSLPSLRSPHTLLPSIVPGWWGGSVVQGSDLSSGPAQLPASPPRGGSAEAVHRTLLTSQASPGWAGQAHRAWRGPVPELQPAPA